MTPESSEPVRAPRTGRITSLVPTPRHKKQPRRGSRRGAKPEGQRPQDADEPDQPEREGEPGEEDADDEHEVDYLA